MKKLDTSRISKQLIGQQKMMLSKLTTLLVNIGKWKLLAKNGVELCVKFYYRWRKIVLEIMRNGSKEIIEIDWTNIIAMQVTNVVNRPQFLELELLHPPRFFKEMNPDPGKHSIRIEVSDFTKGQASTVRKQLFMFPKGELNEHLLKLTEYENHFRELCMKPYPAMIDCPKFIPNSPQIQIGESSESQQQIQRAQRPVYDDFIRLPSPDKLPVANLFPNKRMEQLNPRMNYNVGIGDQMGSIAPNKNQTQRGQHSADFIKLTPPVEKPVANMSNQEIPNQRMEQLNQRMNYNVGVGGSIAPIPNNKQIQSHNETPPVEKPELITVANLSNQEIPNQRMEQLNQRMNYNVRVGDQMGSIAPIPNNKQIQSHNQTPPVEKPELITVANMSNQEIPNQRMEQLNQRMNYNVGIGDQMGSIAPIPNNKQIQSHNETPPVEPAFNLSNEEIQNQRLEMLEQTMHYILGMGDQLVTVVNLRNEEIQNQRLEQLEQKMNYIDQIVGSLVPNNYQLGNSNTERNPNPMIDPDPNPDPDPDNYLLLDNFGANNMNGGEIKMIDLKDLKINRNTDPAESVDSSTMIEEAKGYNMKKRGR